MTTREREDDAGLVEIQGVSKRYSAGRGAPLGMGKKRYVHALDDISLTIRQGEVLGLVGESGSGKSTLGRLIVELEQPTTGRLVFNDQKNKRMQSTHRKQTTAQMVFQSPQGSLNPRQRAWEIVAEPLSCHRTVAAPKAHALALLEEVGLPAHLVDRLPHQLSGGQCQRVGIARAMALAPSLIVCDEPVSALDVSIQAQVLNLFSDLREKTQCAYLFISHDLPVVERMSDRIAIMYLGRIVEIAPAKTFFAPAAQRDNLDTARDGVRLHPYSAALIDAIPHLDLQRRAFRGVTGEIPSPIDPPSGCHFHPRCQYAMDRCKTERPSMRERGNDHFSACHLYD